MNLEEVTAKRIAQALVSVMATAMGQGITRETDQEMAQAMDQDLEQEMEQDLGRVMDLKKDQAMEETIYLNMNMFIII